MLIGQRQTPKVLHLVLRMAIAWKAVVIQALLCVSSQPAEQRIRSQLGEC